MNKQGLPPKPGTASAGEKHRWAYVLIHATVWSMFILFPFLLIDRTGDVRDWAEFLRRLWIVIPFLIVFYANFTWLIGACLFRRQRAGRFILANLLLIALLSGTILAHNEWRHRQRTEAAASARQAGEGQQPPLPRELRRIEESPHGHLRLMALFFMRDFLSLSLTVGLAVALKTTRRWREAEASRQELERSRAEAELRHLKSQLNPHFCSTRSTTSTPSSPSTQTRRSRPSTASASCCATCCTTTRPTPSPWPARRSSSAITSA